MSVQETTRRLENHIVGNQHIPENGFCMQHGFCINSCPLRPTCTVIRTKLLIHCIIIDNTDNSYYPIQYANELPLVPEEVRIETTICQPCDCDDCDNPIFYSRIFLDTYIKYADESGKDFKIFCSQKCMDNYEQKLKSQGYKCVKIKPNPSAKTRKTKTSEKENN